MNRLKAAANPLCLAATRFGLIRRAHCRLAQAGQRPACKPVGSWYLKRDALHRRVCTDMGMAKGVHP